MIYSLQKKFVKICGAALAAILIIIFGLIIVFSQNQLNRAMDQLTDKISSNGGRFPDKFDNPHLSDDRGFDGFITEETKFSTRYFSVDMDSEDNIISVNLDSISSITEEKAISYAKKALDKSGNRGWTSYYRYKIYSTQKGKSVVFVDGSMNRSMSASTVLTACLVLLGSFLIVFFLIIFFSHKAVKPIAESYEKQKQFITDANHELKTPLTLILTNLDIVESEIGQNEWLSDIRSESEHMSALVNRLVLLTRMDEGQTNMMFEDIDLSKLVSDVCVDFQTLAEQYNKRLSMNIEPDISYFGDKNALRHLCSILLDNAVKYCDSDGEISVCLSGGKHPVICVENVYSEVNNIEIEKLFDRFYRSDKSRTYNGSFGIGLSIAKAIAQNHRSRISAYKKDDSHIGFKLTLK